jgi:hypothetical protein
MSEEPHNEMTDQQRRKCVDDDDTEASLKPPSRKTVSRTVEPAEELTLISSLEGMPFIKDKVILNQHKR